MIILIDIGSIITLLVILLVVLLVCRWNKEEKERKNKPKANFILPPDGYRSKVQKAPWES